MPENTVRVSVVADQSELDGAYDLSLAKLQKMSQGLDTFNKQSVKAFFEAADATKKLNVELGASEKQLDKIDRLIQQVEGRADKAGERTANAFERGARGISVMTRQGTLAMRSLDQIIASAADIAFAFGPEGTIISAIAMVTAGIIAHLETAEQKMIEVTDKFNEHMADMLANNSAEEIAKRAAASYVAEIESQAKVIRDTQLGAWRKIFVDGEIDLPALMARFRLGGEKNAVDTNHADREAADQARKIVESIDGNNKDLEKLKGERSRLNNDISSAEEHLRGLDAEKNKHEITETESRLSAARKRLSEVEALTSQLEKDRDARLQAARADAILRGDAAQEAALDERSKTYKTSDLGAEHSQRDENIALSGRGSQGRRQDQEDAKRAREAEQAREREARGLEMLQQMRDEMAERYIRSTDFEGLADMVAAQKEYDRRIAEIDRMKITEDLKTQLMVAALEDREAKMAEVNKKIEKAADKAVQEAIKALDKQLAQQKKASDAKAKVIEGVEHGLSQALIHHHKEMGREILAVLLEPEIKHLEALAAKQFVLGGSDAALGNYGGAAKHFAAGALLEAGAGALASFGGSVGGGGGGAGGASSSAASLGAGGSGTQDQTLKIEIVNVTKDQNGREVARTRQIIQRLNDQNVPIRVTL
jgi:hypothetical protein